MSDFVDNLRDVLAPFGAVTVRRMFGGHGVFHDGLMFGLVADEVFYLKVDELTLSHFTGRGLQPFVYQKRDRPVTMSYYQAPEEIFDDPDAARRWAGYAYEAALRGRKTGR